MRQSEQRLGVFKMEGFSLVGYINSRSPKLLQSRMRYLNSVKQATKDPVRELHEEVTVL